MSAQAQRCQSEPCTASKSTRAPDPNLALRSLNTKAAIASLVNCSACAYTLTALTLGFAAAAGLGFAACGERGETRPPAPPAGFLAAAAPPPPPPPPNMPKRPPPPPDFAAAAGLAAGALPAAASSASYSSALISSTAAAAAGLAAGLAAALGGAAGADKAAGLSHVVSPVFWFHQYGAWYVSSKTSCCAFSRVSQLGGDAGEKT
jgi:hypothetical protein